MSQMKFSTAPHDLNAGPLDRPIAYTRFPDRWGFKKTTHEASLRALARRIPMTLAKSKKELPWIKFAAFGDNPSLSPSGKSYRCNANMQTISGLEGDYDAGSTQPEEARSRLQAAGVAALVYTTPSHMQGDNGPRYRVVAPLSRPHDPEERDALMARLNGVLGGELAPESFTRSQAYFVGSVEGQEPGKTYLSHGDFLDNLPHLDAGAIGRPKGHGQREPSAAEPTGLPRDVIYSALQELPNDGDDFGARQDWIKIGAALHAETGGDEEGLDKFHEWSQQHDSYDPDETDRVWRSFTANREGGATGKTIIWEARKRGWNHPAVDEHRRKQRMEEAQRDFDDACIAPGEPRPEDGLSAEEEAEIDELVGGLTKNAGRTGTALTKATRGSRLTFLSPAECASLPARQYVIKGLLAQGDIATIIGAPGAGKSLLAPRFSYAVAQGLPIFGRRTRQGGVFYIAAEDEPGMRARLAALRADHGEADNLYLVGGVSDLLSTETQLEELLATVERLRPALVIIDTLAVAFPGLEENEARGMGQVVAVARSLTTWGAAVILVHHDTKVGDGLPRGHSLLNGALDVSLSLKRQPGEKVVAVKLSKNRNGSTDQEFAFKIGERRTGTDEDGDPVTTAICEDAETEDRRPQTARLTASALAALAIFQGLTQDKDSVDEAVFRQAVIDSRAVSASDKEDSRRKAYERAAKDLTRTGTLQFHEGRFSQPLLREEFELSGHD